MKQGTKKEKAKDEDFRPTSASVCSFSVDVLSCALYLPSIQPAMCWPTRNAKDLKLQKPSPDFYELDSSRDKVSDFHFVVKYSNFFSTTTFCAPRYKNCIWKAGVERRIIAVRGTDSPPCLLCYTSHINDTEQTVELFTYINARFHLQKTENCTPSSFIIWDLHIILLKVKVNLSLCLTEHHDRRLMGEWKYTSTYS